MAKIIKELGTDVINKVKRKRAFDELDLIYCLFGGWVEPVPQY